MVDPRKKFTPSLLFFDLDGVLINSLPDITAAINAAFAENGFAPLAEEAVRVMIGRGARYLIARALEASARLCRREPPPEYGDDFERIYRHYLAYYHAHSAEKTALYPGVRAMLEAGFSRHIPMAIVSNKPRPITLATLTNMNIVQYFESVIGPECVTQIKPAPESLEAALAEISDARHRAGLLAPPADRASMLMTGDSGTDIQAGRAFGAKTCAVLGGYGNTEALLAEKADFVVQSAGELIALLQD